MFEKIENKWTEDSGDYDDMIQKQLSNKRSGLRPGFYEHHSSASGT